MADTPFTTPPHGTEPLNSVIAADRLAFRKALDLFFDAARADFAAFQKRADLDTAEGKKCGHAAAERWATCIEALEAVQALSEAHPDIRAAAREMLRVTPGSCMDSFELMEHAYNVVKLYHANKSSHPGLADLFFEAHAVLEGYRSTQELMAIGRAA